MNRDKQIEEMAGEICKLFRNSKNVEVFHL